MLPSRMKVDIALATIAGTAETLKSHFPELYLQAVEDEAKRALRKWPQQPIYGKKAVRYLMRVDNKLREMQPAFENVHSLAAVLLCWAGIAERLYDESKNDLVNPLRDLLSDYLSNLDLEPAIEPAEKMIKHIERVMEW